MTDKRGYIVVCQQVVTSPGRDWTIVYGWDGDRFQTRKRAIAAGFKIRGSDDFNIAVVEGDQLVSFDWMNDPIGEDDDTMARIARALGLRYAAHEEPI